MRINNLSGAFKVSMSQPVSFIFLTQILKLFFQHSLSSLLITHSLNILRLILLLFDPEHSLDAFVSFIDDDDELGRVRMIRGLCPDVSNGRGYCKSFAVPSAGREIKSIQTIIPVHFPPSAQ